MFKKIKHTVQKVDDTLDQVKTDLSDTSEKMQKVIDESSGSVRVIAKVVTISLAVSILANIISIFGVFAKTSKRRVPSITIQNLYLGAPPKK